MSETQLAVRQPLPASKETLRTLYDECEKCFRSAERSEYRNRRLLECLVRLRDDGDYTFESFLKDRNEIYANVNRDKIDYSPSAEHLS